jgi:hypothetical protein
MHHIDDGSHIANVSQQQVAQVAFHGIKEYNEDQPMEPLGNSRVMGSIGITNSWVHHINQLLFQLLCGSNVLNMQRK